MAAEHHHEHEESLMEKIADKIHGHDSSSDSDNDNNSSSVKSKVYRLFGRETPLHKVFGSGKRVAGGAASGKATVCNMIIEQLHDQRVVLVNQDSFYHNLNPDELSRVNDYNFDHPGGGVIGVSLAVSKKCRSVKCVEINKESKLSFEKTVSRLPPSLDSSISWHQADTSTDPIFWLMGSDVAVVDPPRKGLEPSLMDVLQNISSFKRKAAKSSESSSLKAKDEKRPWVIRAKEGSVKVESKTPYEETNSLPQTLIYISCGWDSFKEDCKALLSSEAWHLHKAHGFNFFPGTQSIEVLAIFKRGKGVGVNQKG